MAEAAQRQAELPHIKELLAVQLAIADDAKFLRFLWAIDALQSGRADEARPYFRRLPDGADEEGMYHALAIRPWELETLANELLTTPKHPYYRVFDHHSWSSVVEITNTLRALENAEYGARRDGVHIFREMGRIAARQFEWQRGFFTVPELYRGAFLYGQGEAGRHFQETHGLTVPDMMFVGFALVSVVFPHPAIRPKNDLHQLYDMGIEPETLRRAFDRLVIPLAEARKLAVELRAEGGATAYKPSLLRRFPCLTVGPRGRSLIAPLPELIMNRVTAGLFYDVVDGGGPIRAEVGRRFETYSLELLSRSLPEARFEKEWRYKTPLGGIDTPDILWFNGDQVRVAIECKAVRMSIGARFGEDPSGERGYEEIAKGIFQLWRFFSHARQGSASCTATADAVGMLLTLDEWFAARPLAIESIQARAHVLADDSGIDIRPVDRRPVAFCTIADLERSLASATEDSLLSAVDVAATEKQGWIFSIVHQEVEGRRTELNPYPFDDAVNELIPWFREIDDASSHAGDDGG